MSIKTNQKILALRAGSKVCVKGRLTGNGRILKFSHFFVHVLVQTYCTQKQITVYL